MTIEITTSDIHDAGHGNKNDPLALALNRVTGKIWSTETMSQGRPMATGCAWLNNEKSYFIDPLTTKALQDFDEPGNGAAFEPRTAVLTEIP